MICMYYSFTLYVYKALARRDGIVCSIGYSVAVFEMNYESADRDYNVTAFVAQLGERKTEDLKVRGSIPRGGIFL